MIRQTLAAALTLALVLIFAQGLRAAPLAAQTTFHVATSGADGNPGTSSRPFRTIRKAVNVADPGDSILVHGGTYPEIVQISRSGTASRRITLTTAGKGEVVISPKLPSRSCSESTPTRDRAIQIMSGADYWTIRGLTIVGGVLVSGDDVTRITDTRIRDRTLPGRGSYNPDAAASLLGKLGVDGADYIRIIDNEIRGRGIFSVAARWGRASSNEIHDLDCGTGAGIWVNSFSDFWRISNNYVHDLPPSEHHFMSEGIRQGRGSSYNIVEDNLVEDLGGDGRGVTVDTYAGWNLIRGNTVRRTDQGLNEQSAGWGNQWIGNRSESNRRYGLNIDGKDGQLTQPDDGVPAKMVVRCNISSGNGNEDLHIGAVQASAFSTNAFSTAWVSPRAENYWNKEGNTWDGSSRPPGERPPKKFC